MTPVFVRLGLQEQGRAAAARRRRALPAEPHRGRERRARPEQQRREGRPRVRPDASPSSAWRSSWRRTATASSPTCASTRARSRKGDFIFNSSANAERRSRCRAWSACTPTRCDDIDDAPRPATSSRCSASSAASGDTFTDGKVNYTMTSMHVPDAVISLAVAPKDKRDRGQLLQGAQPLHQGRPDLPRAPGRGVAADHHQRHGRAPPRHLHRAHEARVQLRGHRGQAAGRVPRDHHPAGRVQLHPQEADRWLGPVRQGGGLHRAAARRRTSRATSSSTTSSAAPSRASSSPPATRASRRPCKKGPLIGFPIVGVRVRHQRRRFARRSTRPKWRSRPPRSWASARPTPSAKPTILEPIMKVEVQFPEEFQGAVVGQVNQRRGVILDDREAGELRAASWPRCR